MLTVENLFSRLARGMLKNTAAVENTNQGDIVPDYHDSIYYLLNEGLTELFTKKVLRKLRVKLTWVADKNVYVIEDDGVGVYLETFSEDADFDQTLFVRVLVCNPIGNNQVRILPDTNGSGISTPVYNTLRIFTELQEKYPDGINVQYQALHGQVTALADVLNVPPALEYALQLYVSSRYLSEMGSADQAKRGDELRALYMREMGEDTAQNMSSTSDVEFDMRFTDRGFV